MHTVSRNSSSYQSNSRKPFRIDNWLVEPELNRISNEQGSVQLEPRVMQVLERLATSAGKVITREELLNDFWSGLVVTEDALTRVISSLRRILDDSPKQPRYIETIRKGGYRFISKTEYVSDTDGDSLSGHPSQSVTSVNHQEYVWKKYFQAFSLLAFVLLLVFIFYWQLQTNKKILSVPTLVKQITSFPGPEGTPAISPDGERIVYIKRGAGLDNFDLFVKHYNSGTELRLTNTIDVHHAHPAWSPDGNQIAFIREHSNSRGLFIVSSLGGNTQKLIDLNSHSHGLDWSPDGKSIVYADGEKPFVAKRLYLFNLSDRTKIPLFNASSNTYGGVEYPVFSPDGKWIAYQRSSSLGTDDIYIIPAQGGEEKRLTFVNQHMHGLDWDNDSKHIILSIGLVRKFGLWRLSVADKNMEWVATSTDWAANPSISVKTGQIIYESIDLGSQIYRMDFDEGSDNYLKSSEFIVSSQVDYKARYSPDGRYITFISSRTGQLALWISDSEGKNLVQLTSFEKSYIDNPYWSPDGGKIAFNATPDGNSDIFVVSTDGEMPYKVTEDGANYRVGGWSKNAKKLFFSSDRDGEWQLWKLDLYTKQFERLSSAGGFLIRVSPKYDSLYYTKPGITGLWQRSLERDHAELLPGTENINFAYQAWVIGKKGVYFSTQELYHSIPYLAHTSFKTGDIDFKHPVHSISEYNLSISPDGKYLLYTRWDSKESDIMLLDVK